MSGHRWLPGTARVAPSSSVTSSSPIMALIVTSGVSGHVAAMCWNQLSASRCSAWAGSPGPMYMTCAVLTQYDPQLGRSTASANAAYTGLSSRSKYAGLSVPRLENRTVLAPTKVFPSAPRP